jgi:hypothetical protein
MANQSDWPPVKVILAFGAAIAAGLVALAYALKIVLPVLCVAIGLGFATATNGLATAGAVASWVAPVAAGSLAVTGITVTFRLMVSAAEGAKEKPYEWSLPILGFANGLFLNLWADLPSSTPSLRFVFGGAVAFLIVVAGACYKRSGWQWKTTGCLLYAVPPFALLAWDIRLHGVAAERSYFAAVSGSAWLAVGGMALIGLIIAMLEKVTRRAT